jgi:hypothetical protein
MSGTNENQDRIEGVLQEIADNPQVTVNEDGTKTVKLTEPVTYAKKQLTEVTFREPRGRDWRETDKVDGEISKSLALAASLSDKPLRVFDDMIGEDALLCGVVAGTMGKKSQIGNV